MCAYLNLKKKLNVVSSTAPFIAAAAIMPGATNWSYGIGWPFGPGTFPISPPTPMPIESRYSNGSSRPVTNKQPHAPVRDRVPLDDPKRAPAVHPTGAGFLHCQRRDHVANTLV